MDSLEQASQQVEQKNISRQVHRFSRLLSQLSEHRWARDGYPEIRSGHVQVLQHVDPTGTRSSLLAQRAQVTKQTMGRLVGELSERGYVAVIPDQRDHRAQQIMLTDRGKHFLLYLSGTLTDLEMVFTEVVGETDFKQFKTIFSRLLAFVEQRHQQIWKDGPVV
ncbi:MarR family winged helix-turn-helix transcriptional regulator [Spirosoma areae]